MALAGKGVLITGGGTGMGRAIALALAAEGSRVGITGRRVEKLEETAALWKGSPSIVHHAADVASRDSVAALFAWAADAIGDVDILVNSAGLNVANRMMSNLDPDDWDKVLQVNATGAFNCIRMVLPQMRERRDGLIININSIAGKRAVLLGGVAYNASKFAMTALGTSVNLEDSKNGVRVTNIYPGEVDTPILDARPQPVSDEHRRRILQPEDVAAAAVMVAKLPPRANVPELVIKPALQDYA